MDTSRENAIPDPSRHVDDALQAIDRVFPPDQCSEGESEIPLSDGYFHPEIAAGYYSFGDPTWFD